MQSTSAVRQPETPNPKANKSSSTESVKMTIPVKKKNLKGPRISMFNSTKVLAGMAYERLGLVSFFFIR